jgi:hypothetical protein
MVTFLDLRRRSPHPNTPRADGKSRSPKNLNSTSFSQAVNYYNATTSRDNNHCGWFYSLMFVDLVKLVGGSSGDVDHRLRKHCTGISANNVSFERTPCSVYIIATNVAAPYQPSIFHCFSAQLSDDPHLISFFRQACALYPTFSACLATRIT